MHLFVGGTRSGKSALAQQWVEGHASDSPGCLLLLATCRVEDDEMQARVLAHRAKRGPAWRVCEEPLDPLAALNTALALPATDTRAIMLDCVSLWIANLLAEGFSPEHIAHRVALLAQGLTHCALPCAVVTAEVGLGLVPDNALGRQFRDILGDANQALARASDCVIFATCGLPMTIKGNL